MDPAPQSCRFNFPNISERGPLSTPPTAISRLELCDGPHLFCPAARVSVSGCPLDCVVLPVENLPRPSGFFTSGFTLARPSHGSSPGDLALALRCLQLLPVPACSLPSSGHWLLLCIRAQLKCPFSREALLRYPIGRRYPHYSFLTTSYTLKSSKPRSWW